MNYPRYLYLCRHGQSQWNAQGLLQGQSENSLSPLGQQQVQELAAKAKHWQIQQIYHSTLGRAAQTAQVCAHALRLIAQPLIGAEERHFGEWQGQPIAELSQYQHFTQSRYQKVYLKPNPSGESTQTVQHRMHSAIRQIVSNTDQQPITNGNRNIMLISHGDAIDCLLTLWVAPVELKNCQAVRLIQAGNTFVWDGLIASKVY
ncbi:histidine phosphatase family protein [Paraglaciecola aquimarina]|uniref:Histidine phosphatase family protein n=1 Tax=Paraglaciecola aquimarina TaxID=1235557 RepID=A0ABU3T130_9ALTE|nr:histidine phosphatase family protein [Paraglaciecola aquimarina]MDU0355968.1 histidine phosphatase family protein [Paraglaciecola aquimarina]